MSPVLPPMIGSRARMATTAHSQRPWPRGRRLTADSPLAVVVVAIGLHPLHGDMAEEAAGLEGEYGDDDDQRHAQLLAVADDVDARGLLEQIAEVGDQVLQHTDDEPAGHGAARARDAADECAGKAV